MASFASAAIASLGAFPRAPRLGCAQVRPHQYTRRLPLETPGAANKHPARFLRKNTRSLPSNYECASVVSAIAPDVDLAALLLSRPSSPLSLTFASRPHRYIQRRAPRHVSRAHRPTTRAAVEVAEKDPLEVGPCREKVTSVGYPSKDGCVRTVVPPRNTHPRSGFVASSAASPRPLPTTVPTRSLHSRASAAPPKPLPTTVPTHHAVPPKPLSTPSPKAPTSTKPHPKAYITRPRPRQERARDSKHGRR